MEEGGHFFVVVEMNVKYRTPARFDDLLSLRTRVVRVTPAKLEHEYRLTPRRYGDRRRRERAGLRRPGRAASDGFRT